MGKKVKWLLGSMFVCLLMVTIIPVIQAASFATLGFSGSGSVSTNQTFTMDIAISNTSSEKTMTMGGIITSSNPSCVSFVSLTAVASGSDVNNNIVSFFNMSGVSGNFTIAKATFKAGSNACTTTINITEPTISSVSGMEDEPATITKSITVSSSTATTKSSDATLATLVPSSGTLSPTFNKSTTSYTLEVESSVSKVNFTATTTNNKAKIKSGLSCAISASPTTCNIVVQAEDGTQKTYSVKVSKKSTNTPDNGGQNSGDNGSGGGSETEDKPGTPTNPKSSDATLSKLNVSGFTLTPVFNKNTTTYSMTVGSGISALKVEAIPTDSNAKVSISGNSGWKEGINVIKVVVTAEDGTQKVYTVNVTKKGNSQSTDGTPTKSSDNYLKDIIINEGELKPKFDQNVNTYNITVPNEITKLNVNAIVNNSKAVTNITGNSDFKVCTKENLYCNTVTIEVKAEDGSIRVYTINVNRSEKGSDNKLEDLEIKNGEMTPEFDPNVYEYTIEIPSTIDKLDIKATPSNEKADVEIIGNEDLKEGNNAVLIKVTDEDGFVQYYRLNVQKEANKKFLGLTLDQWLLLLGILTLIGLLLLILYILLRKKYGDTNPKETQPTPPQSPVIEFKPEFNFGSKNGTDDDTVAAGGTINQYMGIPSNAHEQKVIESHGEVKEAKIEEIPYDPYDEVVTKDELYDALKESIETKDVAKLKMLYAQETLNREKEELRKRLQDDED